MLRIGVVACIAAIALVWAFDRHIVRTGVDLALQPEVRSKIERAMEDQRQLRKLDPDNAEVYRARFEELQTLSRRLEILELNRDAVARRYRILFSAAIGLIVALMLAVIVLESRRTERRLERLGADIERLARGGTPLGEQGDRNDLVGRISSIVVRAGNAMDHERRRVEELKHLSVWQEAMRRQVHDIRGPLTAARLELARVEDLAADMPDNRLLDAAGNVRQEIERISKLTGHMATFASLGPVDRRRTLLGAFLGEFVETFREAWPGLTLEVVVHEELEAAIDRDLIRRVLVNLTENSVAMGEGETRVSIEVDREKDLARITHRDDGPGVPADMRPRLFEPYATTRRSEGGTGLGLAISKKILLDMGGDLRLIETSAKGTTFGIELPLGGNE